MVWLSCIAAGVCLWAVTWLVTRPLTVRASGPLPSGPMAWLWPWVAFLAPLCGPFISWRRRRVLAGRIQSAGLGSDWQPSHVVALQSLAAAAGAAAGAAFMAGSEASLGRAGVLMTVAPAILCCLWPSLWLKRMARRRQRRMLNEFPFLLDLMTLCVEGGVSLQGALQQASAYAPDGPLKNEFQHAMTDIRAGATRQEALAQLAERVGLAALQALVASLAQADHLGMSLGPVLRAQSEQQRNARFLRAEKLALEAPVKMLFPLVVCIFPCTFLVLAFPIAFRLAAAVG